MIVYIGILRWYIFQKYKKYLAANDGMAYYPTASLKQKKASII